MARFGFGGSPGRGIGQRSQRGNGRGLRDGTGSGIGPGFSHGFCPGLERGMGRGMQNGFGMARGAASGTGPGRGSRRCRFEEGDGRWGFGGNRAFAPDQDRGVIARIESAIEDLKRQIAALRNKA